MNQKSKDILTVRTISSAFVIFALAVFKPFGLEMWQWKMGIHLLVLFLLGIVVCMITDLIMKFLLGIPYDKQRPDQQQADNRDVNYFIRQNLWFQFINTPLIALMICLYRHFVLSDSDVENRLSWTNFLETLAIIAFCSFAIGLYWRFKFRSKFLAAELEETRLLNEQLKRLQVAEQEETADKQPQGNETERETTTEDDERQHEAETTKAPERITLTGTTNETVSLQISHLLYIEAVGNYVKVCHLVDNTVKTDMLRATLKQMEAELSAYPMIVRCHRAFMANLQQVERIDAKAGSMQLLIRNCHDYLPVSRSNMAQVKSAIKGY